MSSFDFDDDEPAPKRRVADYLWNVLTFLLLVAAAGVAGFFFLIFNNPNTRLNPFPAPTLLPTLALPTSTNTPVIPLPPTWTVTITLEPTSTEAPRPTASLLPSPTLFSLVTLPATATPTDTPVPLGYPFEVQKGSPVAIQNIYHPELACNWMGVGGQVTDMSGGPVIGLIIKLGGVLPGVNIPEHLTSLTGVALSYGRAGYEFKLADAPVASKQSLWVQLLSQSGVPLSKEIYFDTFESCDKNLIIVNFKQIR